MTPKTLEALDAIIRGERQIEELHWKQQDALIGRKYVDDGLPTEKGLLASSIPTQAVTIMTLGAETYYGRVILPKGTEVLVTWRTEMKGRSDLIDGMIMVQGGMKAVRLFVSPRNTFEKRIIPDLTQKE